MLANPFRRSGTTATGTTSMDRGNPIRTRVIGLAVPVLLEQFLLYLVGLSDTFLTGRFLAVEHLAAVTVSSYVVWFLSSLLMIVSTGATALVARRIGAAEPAQASRITEQALGLALISGCLLAALGTTLAPVLVRAMQLRGQPALEAVGFLRVVLTAMPLIACLTVGNACLRGAGDTRTGLRVMIVVNLLNVSLSWATATGWWVFPRLGFRGIALGTAVAEALGGLLIVAVLARGRAGLRLQAQTLHPDPLIIRQILGISLPAVGESLTNGLCQLWFLGLINRLGETATAAHGVAIRCESIAFLLINAFAVPASTLTGQYLGAGQRDLARRAATTSWRLGLAVLSLLGLGLYTLADPMFALFLGREQPGVARIGVPALQLVAFAMPALATINVLSGALRGAGATRWPWIVVLIGYLAVRLPLTTFLIGRAGDPGTGLLGAWIAMFADLYLRAVLIAIHFGRGRWQSIRL